MTGRPRHLSGRVQRTINLDAQTQDEADRVDNFSQWVRMKLRQRRKARLNHCLTEFDDPETTGEVPTRRLIAQVHGRLNAANTDRTEADAALADHIVEWLTATREE